MNTMASQITCFSIFAQPYVQTQIKENIKSQRHLPLWEESNGDRWIPSQRASNAEYVSFWWRHHLHDV